MTFNATNAADETSPVAINNLGLVTGYYNDANFVTHGFIRDPSGKVTDFDVPGATSTAPAAIDDLGFVTGSYNDSNFNGHGFLRTLDGHFTTFDVPGTTDTYGNAISLLAEIAGNTASTLGSHAFVRYANGIFSEFDATTLPLAVTVPESINVLGAVTGFWFTARQTAHGFIRELDGTTNTSMNPIAMDSLLARCRSISMGLSSGTTWTITDSRMGSFALKTNRVATAS